MLLKTLDVAERAIIVRFESAPRRPPAPRDNSNSNSRGDLEKASPRLFSVFVSSSSNVISRKVGPSIVLNSIFHRTRHRPPYREQKRANPTRDRSKRKRRIVGVSNTFYRLRVDATVTTVASLSFSVSLCLVRVTKGNDKVCVTLSPVIPAVIASIRCALSVETPRPS